eukprot:47948_1
MSDPNESVNELTDTQTEATTKIAEDTTDESTKELVTTEPTQSSSEDPIATESIVDTKESTKPPKESVDATTNDISTINADPSDAIQPETATVVVVEDRSNNISKRNSFQQNTNAKDETTANTGSPITSPSKEDIQTDNPSGFGKDFNWDMMQENHKVKEENKQMIDKLRQKEREICNLEEALTTLHEELKFLETQEVQSVAKDLAKKNRKLTVQLERERSRCAQFQIDSKKLKSELAAFSHHKLSPKKVVEPMSFSERNLLDTADSDAAHAADDNKTDMKHEIQKLKQKLIRSQSEILKHKDFIKKLNIALKKEVGDDTKDINEIIRDGGSWKGRAERIAILQSKLYETKRELELLDDIGRSKQRISPRNKNEEHKHALSLTATERIKQYEQAQVQIEKIQQTNNELRQLIKAKNCRIKGMETTVVSMRSKLKFFVEKSKTDDSLIETLQVRLNDQLKVQNSLHKKEKLLNKTNNEIHSLAMQVNEQKGTIGVLNKTIEDMKAKIMNLAQERTDTFKRMFGKIANDDKLYQIELLKTENEKQKEMLSSYKKNLNNLQKRLSRKASPREQALTHTSRSSKNSKMVQLKERMEAMAQEQQLVKASYLSIIEGKQNEIEICRKMINQQRDIQAHAFKDMNHQLDQIKTQVLNA